MNIKISKGAAISAGIGLIGGIAVGMSRMYWRGHTKGYIKAIDDVEKEYDAAMEELEEEYGSLEKNSDEKNETPETTSCEEENTEN